MSKKIFKTIVSIVLTFMMCGNVFATTQVTPTHQQAPVPNVPNAEQHITPTHQQAPVPNVPEAQQHITPTHQVPGAGTSAAPVPRPGATTTPRPGTMPTTPPTPRPGAMPITPAPGAIPTTPTPGVMPTSPAPGTMPVTPAPGTVPVTPTPGTVPVTPTPRPGTTPGTTPPRPVAVPRTNSEQPFVLDNFKVIEKTLKSFGVDSRKLANYIRQGKKLEDVLRAEKISVKKFKKQVISEYFKAVDQGITNKQLTGQQASQLKKAIKETVKAWLPRK